MKKRILSLVLAVVLALCLLPATAYAATTASGACGKNLTWSLSSTGTLTISGKGAMAEYDSGKMPWIAYKNQIKSVVLAKGITSIAYLSFSRYTKLTSVQIPDSVTDIGASAFDNCTALSDMTLPKNLKTLGWLAFAGCSSLKTLTMPASLTEGGGSAFSKCTGLKEVYFEKGSKAVEFEQFRGCTSLEKVVLPAGLERIGIDAFTGCTSLKSLSIPASVAEIGKYPARSCTSLQEITVASGNRYYTSQNGALYTKDMKTLIQYPGGRTGGVVIPQGVETLNLDSISCPGMTSILLPVSLKLIASAAFYGCDHLTDVYYAGTKAQWALVDNKGSMNEALNQAKIHYNYKNALPPVTAKAEYIASTGKPYLKWTPVEGAAKYEVYRSGTKNGTYTLLGTTANLNYTDSKANAGYIYYYKVKAVNAAGAKSVYSAAVAGTCHCARPVVTPDYLVSTGKPYIKWTAVAGASKYEVYRSGTKNGTYTLLGTTANLNYTDNKANAGYTYYYKVKAVSKVKSSANSYYSTVIAATCHCARPVVTPDYLVSTGKPYIKWTAVAGASKYEVYRSGTKNGTYTLLGTTANLNYTDNKANAGYTYYYKVKAVSKVKSTANSYYSTVVAATCHCAKPVVKIATTSAGNPRLTWNAVTGASQYEIYRATSQSGTYTKMFTTTKTSYTNTSAKAGTTYYYKVKAISKVRSTANSAFSTVVSIKAR